MSKRTRQIYFSASIKGVGADPELGYKIVQHLIQQGHEVLSEHVGGRNQAEMDEVLLRRSGIDKTTLDAEAAAHHIRAIDMQWVDKADTLVAVITGPSLGVGMEIERALLKPERGLPATQIICFVQAEYLDSLSLMIRGIRDEKFELLIYQDFEEICEHLENRL
ncbi:MAG: hypothetical protein WDZ94_04845 [Patescibacteria group bacterium]